MRVDDKTFDEWVREHHRLLFGLAYWWSGSQSDWEELTQETFFQAYRSRHTLKDLGAAKGWLVGILRHCFLHTVRKWSHGREVFLEEAHQMMSVQASLDPMFWPCIERSINSTNDISFQSFSSISRNCLTRRSRRLSNFRSGP